MHIEECGRLESLIIVISLLNSFFRVGSGRGHSSFLIIVEDSHCQASCAGRWPVKSNLPIMWPSFSFPVIGMTEGRKDKWRL